MIWKELRVDVKLNRQRGVEKWASGSTYIANIGSRSEFKGNQT